MNIMHSSIITSAGFLALLFPLVTPLAVTCRSTYGGKDVSWNTTTPVNSTTSYNTTTPSRGKWDGKHDIDTDMDLAWPVTGKTVKYHLDVTNVTMSPDGFEKPMLVFNGQYPGPTIEANWGDDLEITVTNSLQHNGTSIHWHGQRQFGSNEMDGVNGITECPIAPGHSRVYRFRATQYGSSWYHSHYSVQYGDGLVGPMIIHGPATADYDIDLGALPFSDWFHAPIFTVNHAALHASGPPTADNVLVNGSMTSTFGGKHAVTTLTPGKSHMVRLMNTGINNYIHVSLDGHPFTVVAADFVPIVPYTTNSLVMAVGQRYDVIINANQTVGNYWLRVGTGGGRCDGPNTNAANIASIFRYDGAPIADPDSVAAAALPTGCYDETNIVPYVKTEVPQDTPEKLAVTFTNTAGSGNLIRWQVNGQAMLVNLDYPTLASVDEGNSTFDAADHVFTVGEVHKWQYWVIQQHGNGTNGSAPPPLPHPIHLHGHDFYVLDSAANTAWTGDISRLKTQNPIRRDTATLPALGYLVLAFESDNPGAWLMHCHIPFHVAAGLGVQFLERVDEIKSGNGDFAPLRQGCNEWKKWERENYPGGILIEGDSGL